MTAPCRLIDFHTMYQQELNIVAGVCGSYGLPVLQVVGKFRGSRN